MISTIIFWTLVAIVIYCYFGYTIILWIAAIAKKTLSRKKEIAKFEELPDVTLLVAAYNEEDYVEQKIRNTLELSYPKNKLHQVWITDGSTDRTNILLSKYDFVKVLFEPQRMGKTAALNRAIDFINTPFVIFCDANTNLSSNAIIDLITPFSDSNIGCVAGEKRVIEKNAKGAAGNEGFYWRYESRIKILESYTGSVLGAAGELFAIRTSLYQKIPNNTILDDFQISLNIANKGYRIVYNSNAQATENGSANFEEEKKRKVRIAAGGFQLISRNLSLLNPLKRPLLSFMFLSHKVLRWAVVPFCILLAPIFNIIILIQNCSTLYSITIIAFFALFTTALLGHILRNKNIKPHYFYLPYYTVMTNMAQIKGWCKYLAGGQDARWEKATREKP